MATIPLEKILEDVKNVEKHKDGAFEFFYATNKPTGTEYHVPKRKKAVSRNEAYTHFQKVLKAKPKKDEAMTPEQLALATKYQPEYQRKVSAKKGFLRGAGTLALAGLTYFLSGYYTTPVTGTETSIREKIVHHKRDIQEFRKLYGRSPEYAKSPEEIIREENDFRGSARDTGKFIAGLLGSLGITLLGYGAGKQKKII